MDEIVFEVTQEGDGGLIAGCLTKSIATQANDWETWRENVRVAIATVYFNRLQELARIRLHHVRDEVLVQP